MTASNLAAVISPSLIWARIADVRQTNGINRSKHNTVLPNCTSFIKDVHQQTKAVELMVKNAFVSVMILIIFFLIINFLGCVFGRPYN